MLRTRLLAAGMLAAGLAAVAAVSSQSKPADPCDSATLGPQGNAVARNNRFLGKVDERTARCRGGENAVKRRAAPWVDWQNYYAAGDLASMSSSSGSNRLGLYGALGDFGAQLAELLEFNLLDNNGTYQAYLTGSAGAAGSSITVWPQMRLLAADPHYTEVGGSGQQICSGALIRGRTLTGICNDLRNPRMGATGMLFARNVEFDETFPDAGLNQLTRNRHGDRLSLLKPDPQVISRTLFTRPQSSPAACAEGYGKPGLSKTSNCDYAKAPFFNVLAAFWIQFMTHDWFSHLDEGHNNTAEFMNVGCVGAAALGCRPGDRIDRSYVADKTPPGTFTSGGATYLTRAPKTYRNTVTAWWDASQIYGYDERSRQRVQRDPADAARLLMMRIPGRNAEGDRQGYLPLLRKADPKLPDWAGQEAAGFPDNWTIGISFFHNVFAREHNQFVDAFRRQGAASPDADCGLRDPANPARVIRYRDITPGELFEAARLVVSAEIAKIHTIEWTTQLLYNDPLFYGMNVHWGGLPGNEQAVPGMVGVGANKPGWSLTNVDDVNGGATQAGSPFNFPEEFISVYRLHAMVPDLIEYRDFRDPNAITAKVPIVETFRGKATGFMRERGLADWALSLGRQRVGLLALENTPMFLQNLKMTRLPGPTHRIDVAALDLIRDRERGVPRFNEFRRQYALRQLTSFDELVGNDPAAPGPPAHAAQLAQELRTIYGQHVCDASRVITDAQLNDDGTQINDCLGRPNGTTIDNIEDVDTMVGWLAESTRPHGYAISETQFQVFILNASRRIYTDRFLRSSYRPEFYTTLGLAWVNNNGPQAQIQSAPVNGHANQPVSPLTRVLLRVVPELASQLNPLANAFDPWARDRGEFYSLAWTPRKGAESDPAFKQ